MNETVTIDLNTGKVIKSVLIPSRYCDISGTNNLNQLQANVYYNNEYERERLIQKIIDDNVYELFYVKIKYNIKDYNWVDFELFKNYQTTKLLKQLELRLDNTCLNLEYNTIKVSKFKYESDHVKHNTNTFIDIINNKNDINFIVTLIEEFC